VELKNRGTLNGMTQLDQDLIGIWIVPGAAPTYEVMADGTFHVADPESALAFENGGAVMLWDPLRMTRLDGTGETPVGRWQDTGSTDVWEFLANGGYSVTGDGLTYTGIWALRSAGAALWSRELRARIETTGAEVTFAPVHGTPVTYGYTVTRDTWRLTDLQSGAEVARYVRPSSVLSP